MISMCCFLFLFFLSVRMIPWTPTQGYILFGESIALTGNTSDVGNKIRSGLFASFNQLNSRGGLFNQLMLNITVKDDEYEPNKCRSNTIEFLQNSNIFALAGYLGTATTLGVRDLLISHQVPLIGSLTGALSLRDPFTPYFITTRPTHEDESTAMINYLVRKKYILRISILYQNDPYGIRCFHALRKSMDPYRIEITSNGTYHRNSLEQITESLAHQLHEGYPEAIVIAGTPQQIAKFVWMYRTMYANENTIFLSYSIGPKAIATAMEGYGVRMSDDNLNVIVFEAVPNISNEKDALVQDYLDSLRIAGEEYIPSFKGLEGYIMGKTIIEMIRGIYGSISRENFIKSAFDFNHNFRVDNLMIGDFYRNSSERQGCNQGMDRVWPVRIVNSTLFEDVPEAEYSWSGECLSNSKQRPVIFFMQSACMSDESSGSGNRGWFGDSYQRGIKSAFFEYNSKRTFSERIVGIMTRNDEGDPEIALKNLEYYLSPDNINQTIGFVGWMGTNTLVGLNDTLTNTEIAFLGPYTGSEVFRAKDMSNIINIRVGVDMEIGGLIQHFFDSKKTIFSVLYQDDERGREALVMALRVLEKADGLTLFSNASFIPHDEKFTIDRAVHEILYSESSATNPSGSGSSRLPEVILMFGNSFYLSQFVQKVVEVGDETKSIAFASLSSVGYIPFKKHLSEQGIGSWSEVWSRVYLTQVVPHFNDSSQPIVNEYRNNMKKLGFFDEYAGYVSFEGYLVGSMVTQVLSKMDDLGDLESLDFLNKIYSLGTIPLGSIDDERTITLGKFDRSREAFCNTGLRKVWVSSLAHSENDPENEKCKEDEPVEFQSCNYDDVEPTYPVFFGQTYDYRITPSVDFSTGIEHAFDEKNEEKTGPANLFLLRMDDNSTGTIRDENTDDFDFKNTLSFVGYESFELESVKKLIHEHNKKLIAPIRTDFGGDAKDKGVFYLRPFVMDEVYYSWLHFVRKEKSVAVVFRESDWMHEYEIRRHFEEWEDPGIVMIFGTDNQILVGLSEEYFDVLIYIVDDSLALLKEKIIPSFELHERIPEFVFPSFVYGAHRENLTVDHYFVSLFSRSSIFYNNFVNNYQSEFESVDYAFLGYIVGKFIINNFESTKNHGGVDFFENIEYQDSFDIANDVMIKFGPDCNVGIKRIYIYDNDDELEQDGLMNFKECTVWKPIEDPDEYEKVPWWFIFGPFGAVAAICLCPAVFCVGCVCFICIGLSCIFCLIVVAGICANVFIVLLGVMYSVVNFCLAALNCVIFERKRREKSEEEKDELEEQLLDKDVLLKEAEKMTKGEPMKKRKVDKKVKSLFMDLSEVECEIIWDFRGRKVIKIGDLDDPAPWPFLQTVKLEKGRYAVEKFWPIHSIEGAQRDNFLREAFALQRINARINVMKPKQSPFVDYYGVFRRDEKVEKDKSSVSTTVGLIIGFYLGDLTRFIHNPEQRRSTERYYGQVIEFLHQIAEGLEKLHSMDIIHRDIKPANILLSIENKAIICDFGTALILETPDGGKVPYRQQIFEGLNFGTAHFVSVILFFLGLTISFAELKRAPELLKKYDSKKKIPELDPEEGKKVDVYSFGVLMYESIFGAEIIKVNRNKVIFNDRLKEGSGRFRKLYDLCERCCRRDPTKRQDSKIIAEIFRSGVFVMEEEEEEEEGEQAADHSSEGEEEEEGEFQHTRGEQIVFSTEKTKEENDEEKYLF